MTDTTESTESTTSSRLEQARRTIRNHVIGAGATPLLLPLPFIDLAVVAGVQLNMLRSLAKIYERPFSEELAKKLLGALVGTSVPAAAVGLLRAIPVVGQLGAAVGGAASTHAIGEVFVQHFESGGTLLGFDPAKVREHYRRELENAQNAGGEASGEDDYGGVRP